MDSIQLPDFIDYLPLYAYLTYSICYTISTAAKKSYLNEDNHTKIAGIVINIIYMIFWAAIIYYLCKSSQYTWAWLIVLLLIILS
jgi:uncharacterized membrane protein